MEMENISSSSYNGTKRFTQQQVPTSNATGFGAAADDYMERGIDLNEQLIRNKPATFFMKVRSNSMINAGIGEGDIVIVDKSVKPVTGKIVIAVIDGEMLIRRYEQSFGKLRLIAETDQLASIEIPNGSDCKIWGVVVHAIKSF